jgi:hypothetical protein
VKNLEKYIKNGILNLIRAGITLELHQRNSHADYFDDKKRFLCCSTVGGLQEWGQNFVHEYCHFLQWRDKRYVGELYDKSSEHFEQWIKKMRHISIDELIKTLNRERRIEIDCEKRVIKEIDKYSLEIDKDRYIRKANAYIYSFNMIVETRQDASPDPSEVEEIIDIMPNRFLSRYDRTPQKYRKLYLEYCL